MSLFPGAHNVYMPNATITVAENVSFFLSSEIAGSQFHLLFIRSGMCLMLMETNEQNVKYW